MFDGRYSQIALAQKEMPVGLGWRGELVGVDLEHLKDSSGLDMTGATVPAVSVSSNQIIATFVASGSAQTATMRFKVPRDYDDSKDNVNLSNRELCVQFSAKMGGSTDSPTLSVAAVAQPPTGAAKTAYTAATVDPSTSSTASAHVVTGTTNDVYTFNLGEAQDGNGVRIKPGDEVTLTITVGSTGAFHGTDALVITSVAGFYRKMPNFSNIDARTSYDAQNQT